MHVQLECGYKCQINGKCTIWKLKSFLFWTTEKKKVKSISIGKHLPSCSSQLITLKYFYISIIKSTSKLYFIGDSLRYKVSVSVWSSHNHASVWLLGIYRIFQHSVCSPLLICGIVPMPWHISNVVGSWI